MKIFLHLVFSGLFPFILFSASAQVDDSIINSDPVLVNGKLYVFHPPFDTGGNQFFKDHEFFDGSLRLKGITYYGLKLNYDVYNQQLILKYSSNTGAVNQIIVPDGWLESFTLNDRNFQLLSVKGKKEIFQVIGEDNIRILYSWRKKLELSQVHGAKNHVFSKPIRTMHLVLDNNTHQYGKNKSFYSLFDQARRVEIKDYLRMNRVNVRKAGDSSISALIKFCNSI